MTRQCLMKISSSLELESFHDKIEFYNTKSIRQIYTSLITAYIIRKKK